MPMPALVTTGPSILFSTAFACAFFWLSAALGRRLLILFRTPALPNDTARVLIAVALGAGALQFVPFALGAAGILHVSSLRIAIAVIALSLTRDLIAVAGEITRGLKAFRPSIGFPAAAAFALAPSFIVALFLALTPTLDPDGLGYHLTVPKRWLETGVIGYLPTYPYSNTPMGVEMLFSIALTFAGDAAAKILHFACGFAGAFGLYLAGTRLRSKLCGAAAAAIYLVGPVGVGGVLGCAYLEGSTGFAMIASALAWILWFQGRDQGIDGSVGWLRAAFVLAGVAVSFKITSALFPVALAILTLAIQAEPANRQDRPLLQVLRPVLTALLLGSLPVLPWLVRAALVTGNPLFPLFAQWIPSRDLSPALAKQFEDYNRYMLWASRAGAHWSLALRKLVLLGGALLTIAIGTVAFIRLRSYMARATTLVVVGTVLVQLGAVGLYARYWIPLLAVIELPLLLALPNLPAAFPERWLRALVVAAAALGSLVQARQGIGSAGGDVRGLVATAFGLESQRAFLLEHLPLFPLYERANQSLPGSAKIVLSTYCGGFYLDRTTYCAEFVQDSLRLTGWEPFTEDLRRLGATHVLAPRALRSGNGAPPGGGSVSEIYREQQNTLVGRLLNDHGHLLQAASDQGLYEIELGAN